MSIGTDLSETMNGQTPDIGTIKTKLDEITILVKELEEIRDFGMNAAVIALSRQTPEGKAIRFRDVFLREWGSICRQMMESKFEESGE